MLLISDLDTVAPDSAKAIRHIAEKIATAQDWPHYVALDYVLLTVDKNVSQKRGESFVPNDVSCKLYEEGRRGQ